MVFFVCIGRIDTVEREPVKKSGKRYDPKNWLG